MLLNTCCFVVCNDKSRSAENVLYVHAFDVAYSATHMTNKEIVWIKNLHTIWTWISRKIVLEWDKIDQQQRKMRNMTKN